YTVRKATQGLANYILKQNGAEKGVAIAYDSRHFSPEFSDEAALCLAANGIKAYVFDSLRPTPELSFAVRQLGCISGINITASHNKPQYNGYKVYWEDGAQITPPHDTGIMAEVEAVSDWASVKTMEKQAAIDAGLYQVIGAEIDDAFIETIKSCCLHPEAIRAQKDLKIVYTPLHGTGNIPARRVLKELGFEQVYVVPEQELPDGNFPTVDYPNPEAEEAFEMALELGKKIGAELILATDPDADRLGCRVRDKDGNYHTLTGNMSACLLAHYEISQKKALFGLPDDGELITTIVSSNLAAAIARYYNAKLVEVLTGFKWIGKEMLRMEKEGHGTYLFGFEESYGCLIGTFARDKDSIGAVMALSECAAWYKERGMTMWDAMLEVYETYGYYADGTTSLVFEGVEGAEKISCIMDSLRNMKLESLGAYRVQGFRDYDRDFTENYLTGETGTTGLPKSNVLYYELNDDCWVCVRPSGTEPKVKFYYGVVGESLEDAQKKGDTLGKDLLDLMSGIVESAG
ncbi:MAG: phospho-sugar mutase, partial [Eubacterium sp.]|nr:phospho-sugar mutase [Eubacterium sp.]